MTAIAVEVLREIRDRGLLLVTDRERASVTTLVAGEPVAGSWWSHRAGRRIYEVLCRLEEEPDLLLVKLVEGKETFVYRALWPELFTIALSREDWQTRGLAREELALLERVEREGTLRLENRTDAKSARSLERRLLVRGAQLHTDSGAHAKVLQTWERVARERGFSCVAMDVAAARTKLESRATGRLPWRKGRKLRTRDR